MMYNDLKSLLVDIKLMCQLRDDCDGCEFAGKYDECMLKEIPQEWKVSDPLRESFDAIEWECE